MGAAYCFSTAPCSAALSWPAPWPWSWPCPCHGVSLNTNQQFPAHRKKLIKPKSCKDIRGRVAYENRRASWEQGGGVPVCWGVGEVQRARKTKRELHVESGFKATTH